MEGVPITEKYENWKVLNASLNIMYDEGRRVPKRSQILFFLRAATKPIDKFTLVSPRGEMFDFFTPQILFFKAINIMLFFLEFITKLLTIRLRYVVVHLEKIKPVYGDDIQTTC